MVALVCSSPIDTDVRAGALIDESWSPSLIEKYSHLSNRYLLYYNDSSRGTKQYDLGLTDIPLPGFSEYSRSLREWSDGK
jgi:hypothetical protein